MSSHLRVLVPCQYRSQKLRVLSKNLVLSGVLTPCCAGLVLRVTLDFVSVGIYSSGFFYARRIVRKGVCVRVDLIDLLRHYFLLPLVRSCASFSLVTMLVPASSLCFINCGTSTPHTGDLVRAEMWSLFPPLHGLLPCP